MPRVVYPTTSDVPKPGDRWIKIRKNRDRPRVNTPYMEVYTTMYLLHSFQEGGETIWTITEIEYWDIFRDVQTWHIPESDLLRYWERLPE
jgi:hypothetical protein